MKPTSLDYEPRTDSRPHGSATAGIVAIAIALAVFFFEAACYSVAKDIGTQKADERCALLVILAAGVGILVASWSLTVRGSKRLGLIGLLVVLISSAGCLLGIIMLA